MSRSLATAAQPLRRIAAAALLASATLGSTRPLLGAQTPDSTPPIRRPPPVLGPMRTIAFDTDEGTWTSLAVSPDGGTLVFDMLGDLYSVSSSGGDARVLMAGRAWDHMPRFSPNGKTIAFISDRDGAMNLWIANADGSNPKQLSKARDGNFSSPIWSPDGNYVLAVGQSGVWMYHQAGGSGVKLAAVPTGATGPALSPDGRFLYVSAANTIQRLDRLTNEVTTLTGRGTSVRPLVSPDGKSLAYIRVHDAASELRLRDLVTGAERVLLTPGTPVSPRGQQDAHPGYSFSPDGRSIFISAGGKIHRVDVATGADQIIPFRVHVSQEVAQRLTVPRRVDDGNLAVKVIRWPTLSPNGRQLAFNALGKIWITDLTAETDGNGSSSRVVTPRRLTNASEREYAPSFSPDGRWIAYTTWTDGKLGQVMLVGPDGSQRKALTTVPGRYTNPAWSRDGSKLVVVRGTGVEARGEQAESDPNLELVVVDVTRGQTQIVTTLPSAPGFYGWRFHPIASFSDDGTRILYREPRGNTRGSPSLVSVRLDGTDKRTLMSFPSAEELIPSPDGHTLAVVRRENVMVMPIPPFGSGATEISFDSPALPVRRLTTDGGVYVGWIDSQTMMWSFTNRIYRQRVDGQTPELLAEIALTAPRARPAGSIAFTNARVITMRGDTVLDRATVVVTNSRIAAVGANVAIPRDATVVDARGKTIMPGVIDVHAHRTTAAEVEIFPEQRWQDVVNLAYGVTTMMDPSAPSLQIFGEAELEQTGAIVSPRIYSTGGIVFGPEPTNNLHIDITGIEDARHVVKRYTAYGAAMLKEYMHGRRDERQWLAQAAREASLPITAEGGGDLVMDLTMMADGYTAVEHSLPIAPLFKDVVEFVARTGSNYTPTLIVSYGGPSAEAYFYQKFSWHDDAKLRRFTPEEQLDMHRQTNQIPDEDYHFINVSKSAAKITHAGGKVTLGAHGNRQGLGAQWELWGLSMGGLTPLETIRASTLLGAEKFGVDRDLGSIEVGKLADFLVLDANPLEDIHNTAKIRYTVKNGFVYDAASMTEVWPQHRALPRFYWQSEAERARFAAPLAAALGGRKP